MKRTYTKPALVKEVFELDGNLASSAGCKVISRNHSLQAQCNYEPNGLGYFIFAEGWSSCVDAQINENSADSVIYCYHAGINNLFNS